MSSSPLVSTTLIAMVPVVPQANIEAMPLTKPVDEFRAKPLGSEPVTIEYVRGEVAPVTTAGKFVAINVEIVDQL